jgi:hypothetical protein
MGEIGVVNIRDLAAVNVGVQRSVFESWNHYAPFVEQRVAILNILRFYVALFMYAYMSSDCIGADYKKRIWRRSMSVEDNCGSSSSDDGAWPDPSPFIARRSYRSPPPSAYSSFSTPRASGGSRGISNFVEEQLLRDIEAFGGIASVNLSHICNLKTETYGAPHSLERKKIQNKVNRWKALSVRDYRRVLDLYEIDANTPRTRRASTTPPPTSSEGQEPTSEEQNNNSLSALAIRFQPADLQATPGESEFIRFSSSLQIMLSTPTAGPLGMKSGSKNIMYIQRVLAAGEFGM